MCAKTYTITVRASRAHRATCRAPQACPYCKGQTFFAFSVSECLEVVTKWRDERGMAVTVVEEAATVGA